MLIDDKFSSMTRSYEDSTQFMYDAVAVAMAIQNMATSSTGGNTYFHMNRTDPGPKAKEAEKTQRKKRPRKGAGCDALRGWNLTSDDNGDIVPRGAPFWVRTLRQPRKRDERFFSKRENTFSAVVENADDIERFLNIRMLIRFGIRIARFGTRIAYLEKSDWPRIIFESRYRHFPMASHMRSLRRAYPAPGTVHLVRCGAFILRF